MRVSRFSLHIPVFFAVAILLSVSSVYADSRRVYADEYLVEFPQTLALGGEHDHNFDRSRIEAARAKVVHELRRRKRLKLVRPDVLELNESEERRVVDFDQASKDAFCAPLLAQGASFCEPNFRYESTATPNDPLFGDLWGMEQANDIDIDAKSAWNISTGSDDVVVAVIDSGVDYNHPDLKDNMWRNPGEIAGNGIDDDGNGVVDDIYGYDALQNDGDPMDLNGHGTHCAGTIGGRGNNGKGVAGVNWNVKIMGVRFLNADGGGSLLDAVKALDYVTEMKTEYDVNVVVANNSWGGTGYSQALEGAIERARDAGIIFAAAAGNSAIDNDELPHYPSSYEVDNVVSVAAIDSQSNLAYFSNYGVETVDIAAPGVSIKSTYPGSSYVSLSGTSMATPHVSGALALLRASEPNLSMDKSITRLYEAGVGLSTLTGIVRTGRTLNAHRMLAKLTSPVPPPPMPAEFMYEIAQTGYAPDTGVKSAPIVLQKDELGYVGYDLPFLFPFYGKLITRVYISPNGVLYTKSSPPSMDYSSGENAPKNSIAVVHTDLVASGNPYGVRVKSYGNKVVFYWRVEHYQKQGQGDVEAWAELHSNGTIVTSYSVPSAPVETYMAYKARLGVRGGYSNHIDTYEGALAHQKALRYRPMGDGSGIMSFASAPGKVRGKKSYPLDVSGKSGSNGTLSLVVNNLECSLDALQVRSDGLAEMAFKLGNHRFRGKARLQLIKSGLVQSVHEFNYRPSKAYSNKMSERGKPIVKSTKVKQKLFNKICNKVQNKVFQLN